MAAAALANARAFGGEDYVGFHTLMALAPAYHIAAEETDAKLRPLAVLKVLFRNATRLKRDRRPASETLKPVAPAEGKTGRPASTSATRCGRWTSPPPSGRSPPCARASRPTPSTALMEMVDDATEVHRVVLVSRSWDLLDFVGKDAHAHPAAAVGAVLREERGARRTR